MVVEERVVRFLFDRFFEQANGGRIDVLVVEGPAQGVGGVWIIGKLTAGRLRHRESDVHIATLLQHHVRQVVGGHWIFRLNLKHLLVLLPGVVPILLVLVDATGQQVESDLLGIDLRPIEIRLQRLIRGAAFVLHQRRA